VAQTLTRINLKLLGLVVLLAALTWWPATTPDNPGDSRLSDLVSGQIHSLTIQGLDEVAIQLSRHNQRWWLDQPRQLPANPLKVEALLALAGAPTYARFSRPAAAREQAFIATDADHWVMFDQLQVVFGNPHPLGHRRYLMVRESTDDPATNVRQARQPGDEILLVDDLYYHHLRSHWTDWVSRQPVPAGVTLTRLKLPDTTLTADPQGWYAAPPKISTEQINQLISQWQNLVAKKVSALPADTDPTDLEAIEIDWLDESGGAHTLALYWQQLNSELQLLDIDQGIAWHVDNSIAEKLVLPTPGAPPR